MANGILPFSPFTSTGKHYAGHLTSDAGKWVRGVIGERVTFTADAYVDLSAKLPKNSRVIAILLQCAVAGVINTGTHISVGFSDGTDDPDAFLNEQTFTSYNAVGNVVIENSQITTIYTTEKTIAVFSVNSSGAASGTITSGAWDVVVFYETFAGFSS